MGRLITGDRFSADSVNWTDFFAPVSGCNYVIFLNEGPAAVERRTDKTNPSSGQFIEAGLEDTVVAGHTIHAVRFPAGSLIASFKAQSGTVTIFPTIIK